MAHPDVRRRFIAEVKSALGFVAVVPSDDESGFDVLEDARQICWLHWAQDGAPKGAVYRVVSFDPMMLVQAQAILASLPTADVPIDMTSDRVDEDPFDTKNPDITHREFVPFGDLVFRIEHMHEMVLDADAAAPVGSLEHVNQCRKARKLPPIASLDEIHPDAVLRRILRAEFGSEDPAEALERARRQDAAEYPQDYRQDGSPNVP